MECSIVLDTVAPFSIEWKYPNTDIPVGDFEFYNESVVYVKFYINIMMETSNIHRKEVSLYRILLHNISTAPKIFLKCSEKVFWTYIM